MTGVQTCALPIYTLGEKISKVEACATDIKTAVSKMAEKNNDRLINWGIGIIVFLLGLVGWMTTHFIIK